MDWTKPIPLPCRHDMSDMIFSAEHMRDGATAEEMLDYLIDNHMIKHSAYEVIREKGGNLCDGKNSVVPKIGLSDDEREDMDWSD